jgi:hypothetical protein
MDSLGVQEARFHMERLQMMPDQGKEADQVHQAMPKRL